MKKRLLALLILAFSNALPVSAAEELSLGQVLYLPIYSHVWYGNRGGADNHPLKNLVSALVSIRNTNLKSPIWVTSARYYDTKGKLLTEYLSMPAEIKPMSTLELFVERKESEGGSGANFVIQWNSAAPSNPPIVEALHADIKMGSQALIFITTARPIQADK